MFNYSGCSFRHTSTMPNKIYLFSTQLLAFINILLACEILYRFRDSLTLNSRDWFYAENALTTSNVKWKNQTFRLPQLCFYLFLVPSYSQINNTIGIFIPFLQKVSHIQTQDSLDVLHSADQQLKLQLYSNVGLQVHNTLYRFTVTESAMYIDHSKPP